MEDLGEMQNLSESLNNGAVDVGLAGRVARVVGLVHAATWRNDLSDEHWGQMRDKELRSVTSVFYLYYKSFYSFMLQ